MNNNGLDRLRQRQKERIMNNLHNNITLDLVKMVADDYRLVLKAKDEVLVKFGVKRRTQAEHFITQTIYDLDDTTYATGAGNKVAVKTGLVCLDNQDRYFIEDDEWELLQAAQLADKALELISDKTGY